MKLRVYYFGIYILRRHYSRTCYKTPMNYLAFKLPRWVNFSAWFMKNIL